MQVQIEISTFCNFTCFYCAGRNLRQGHMDLDLFQKILHQLPPGRHRISLQGEGEPTLHPRFWDMVDLVCKLGHTPYTITNGLCIEPQLLHKYLPKIGISIDTLDAAESKRIGRPGLERVLRNLDRLLSVYEVRNIIIYSVDYGQDLAPLAAYLKTRGVKHIIQPLQGKHDYARRYPELVRLTTRVCSYSCRYAKTPIMLYYNLDGVAMPCCFIKDASLFVSIDHIRDSLARRLVPACCEGCNELYE
jgi:MoaA/NifB/PqqE/SkfB family radical SAM enzyme